MTLSNQDRAAVKIVAAFIRNAVLQRALQEDARGQHIERQLDVFESRADRCGYLTLAEAAPQLGMTTAALRKRCTRGARREGRMIVARVGDLVAVKFGRSWRLKWPSSGGST